MWRKFVKDYLSFTKKDRVGVIVLVTLIFIVLLLPYIWPAKKIVQPSPALIAKIKLQAAQLNKADDAAAPEKRSYSAAPDNYPTRKNNFKPKAALFYFDPNTLDAAGWVRLGIREKTAATIVNYLLKGGHFRRPEDIGKIYGLFKDDYERLLPYVKIASAPVAEKTYYGEKKKYDSVAGPVYKAKRLPLVAIDVNLADTSILSTLPGIGSKLAARIINFRDKLGGFYKVEQVAETYGLPDSTFAKIVHSLECSHSSLKQLNINNVDANALKQHPYIRWNLANAILQYRAQHGNFKSVDDLQQIAVITPEVFEKIKPYLAVQ